MGTLAAVNINSRKGFLVALALVVALGAVIRVGYTLGWKQDKESCQLIGPENICGDAYVYHAGANLLADGEGFVSPPDYYYGGTARASADHPPLYVLYLAAFSLAGLRSVLAHQMASILLGLGSIVLCGFYGRSLVGPRVGLLAALLCAVYPYVWVNDALVMSETVALTCTVGLAWLGQRFLRAPSTANAVWFGVMGGVTALTRAELVLFVPILGFAWAFGREYRRQWRVWVRNLLAMGLCSAAVISPWVIRNLTTFKYPVTLSTGLGITLTYTNCDEVYYGDLLGYWYLPCIYPVPQGVDQSDDERMLRERGLDYLRDHQKRLPVVVAARLGRQWGVFRPAQMTALDTFDARDRPVTRAGLTMYYGMVPLAVIGAVVLRRHGERLLPLLAIPAIISVAAMGTYGSTRFRVPAELTLMMLAAIGMAAWWDAVRRRTPPPA